MFLFPELNCFMEIFMVCMYHTKTAAADRSYYTVSPTIITPVQRIYNKKSRQASGCLSNIILMPSHYNVLPIFPPKATTRLPAALTLAHLGMVQSVQFFLLCLSTSSQLLPCLLGISSFYCFSAFWILWNKTRQHLLQSGIIFILYSCDYFSPSMWVAPALL